MQSDTPSRVYKILTADIWNGAADNAVVPTMPIDISDGFIHLSTAAQLLQTLALHFKGQSGLVVLTIRTADIRDDLRWEPSRGGQLFPHVYGQIPRTAVVREITTAVDEDGNCQLPDDLD